MREKKKAHLEAGHSSSTTDTAISIPATASLSASVSTPSMPPTSSSSVMPDDQESTPRSDVDSENERPDYSSSEDEFDPQTVFDDWVSSLRLYDRKMLAVLLSITLQKRFNLNSTSAALESAWITGFNEKTIRVATGRTFLTTMEPLRRREEESTRD